MIRNLIVIIAFLGMNLSFAGSMGENNTSPNKLEIYVSGGPTFSKLQNDTSVAINSYVINTYNTNEQANWQSLWGIGFGRSLDYMMNTPFRISLALAAYKTHLGKVQGTEYPFINDDSYDYLNYQFTAKSTAALAEARLFYKNYNWQPFVLFGIGCSWNRLKNYSETPVDPSLSAAPVTTQFGNHTNSDFAYELGAGVQHQLYEDMVHKTQYFGAVDYRYIYLGNGQLASIPTQIAGEALQIAHMNTQGIMFSLKISFS